MRAHTSWPRDGIFTRILPCMSRSQLLMTKPVRMLVSVRGGLAGSRAALSTVGLGTMRSLSVSTNLLPLDTSQPAHALRHGDRAEPPLLAHVEGGAVTAGIERVRGGGDAVQPAELVAQSAQTDDLAGGDARVAHGAALTRQPVIQTRQ